MKKIIDPLVTAPDFDDYIEIRIAAERARQDKKWGIQTHSFGVWMTILQEEVGELAKAFLESDIENAEDEAVQVAAVASAIAGAIARLRSDLL